MRELAWSGEKNLTFQFDNLSSGLINYYNTPLYYCHPGPLVLFPDMRERFTGTFVFAVHNVVK